MDSAMESVHATELATDGRGGFRARPCYFGSRSAGAVLAYTFLL